MPRSSNPEDKKITSDQAMLIAEVGKRTQPLLKLHDWEEIASSLGIGNGKAAKERFRYLMNSVSDNKPPRTSKQSTSTTTAAEQKKVGLNGLPKRTTPSRKRKLAESEENTAISKPAGSMAQDGENEKKSKASNSQLPSTTPSAKLDTTKTIAVGKTTTVNELPPAEREDNLMGFDEEGIELGSFFAEEMEKFDPDY